jgi:hypothetical protein
MLLQCIGERLQYMGAPHGKPTLAIMRVSMQGSHTLPHCELCKPNSTGSLVWIFFGILFFNDSHLFGLITCGACIKTVGFITPHSTSKLQKLEQSSSFGLSTITIIYSVSDQLR